MYTQDQLKADIHEGWYAIKQRNQTKRNIFITLDVHSSSF